MSKTLFLSALICLLATSHSFAKIWRVNNNPGVAADFTTLQNAHDSASQGDTLHVEGSPTAYGYLDCRQKLIIIGPGYYLAENPNTQEFLHTAKVSTSTFYDGSSGSLIMGLEFISSINIKEDSITIKRNKFNSALGNDPENHFYSITISYSDVTGSVPLTNISISQNYGLWLTVPYAASGIFITNNYFARPGPDGTNLQCLSISENAEAVIQNNIFRRGKVTISSRTVFAYNIMYAGSFESGGDSLVAYNIWNSNQFPAINGNKTGVDMNSVFVGTVDGKYTDAQWKLKAGSPAIGVGSGSTTDNPIDAGMYSGGTPYVVSGMPPVPHIYFLDVTPFGSNAEPIKVRVKVKSGG